MIAYIRRMESPSHTLITIYEETTPNSINLTKVYDQICKITKINPWLTGRLLMTQEGVKVAKFKMNRVN